jgi:hypothetical protein
MCQYEQKRSDSQCLGSAADQLAWLKKKYGNKPVEKALSR